MFHLDRPALRRMAELGSVWAVEELVKVERAMEAVKELARKHGIDETDMGMDESLGGRDIPRYDPVLLAVAAERGADLGLKIVEIPDGVEYEIQESEEGYEWIAEKHRKWS